MRTFCTVCAFQVFKMRSALALLAFLVSPLLLECATTCKVGNQMDYDHGLCPVKLTSVPSTSPGGFYAERVTVRVWMTADDLFKAPKIKILSPEEKTFTAVKKKCHKRNTSRTVKCSQHCKSNSSVLLWELVHSYIHAEALHVVTVAYSAASTNCNVSYTVPDPMPDFDVFVKQSSKSITVIVNSGNKVSARLCYHRSKGLCSDIPGSPPVIIDPSQSTLAHFNITYLLPCLCVEVYFNHTDALRNKKCPFQKERLADVRDIWLSSEVELYESSLQWVPKCLARDLPLNISASLCWMLHEDLCIPILNSTLEESDDGRNPTYNTSAVDTHRQMCVQFSLQGSYDISCPFQDDMSLWEVHIGPGRQSVIVYLTSLVPAMFSAQFCVLNKMGCTPIGPVYALRMGETQINILPHFVAERPCVQVWQSDPALHGRRILCPDYTHNRWGIYAVAVLIFIVIVSSLGIFIQKLTRSGSSGWLYIQKPVLLVCSSEQSAHVSSVCALASILQGELSATVHMALWAQSSTVTDLGPLPWLYGQWEAVRKAQGKVLIIWSPEAKKSYEKWRERTVMDNSDRKKEDNARSELRHESLKVQVDYKLNGRLEKCKKEKAIGKKDSVELCDDKVPWTTLTGPVFVAALACLEGALQHSKSQGVAIVYFQGFGHNNDIPKTLRGVPRYCLPQDFRGLIQELGGMRRQTKTDTFTWHCWPRLLSKVLSIWLARKLANRLQTLLPKTQGKKTQQLSFTSSQKIKTQRRLKLPTEDNMARVGTTPEQEPLHKLP